MNENSKLTSSSAFTPLTMMDKTPSMAKSKALPAFYHNRQSIDAKTMETQFHPLGIQSSASCPPHMTAILSCVSPQNIPQEGSTLSTSALMHNLAHHYGMAVNGFHPQNNAHIIPPFLPPSKQKKIGINEQYKSGQIKPVKVSSLVKKMKLNTKLKKEKIGMENISSTTSMSCDDRVENLVAKTAKKEESKPLKEKEQKTEKEDSRLNEKMDIASLSESSFNNREKGNSTPTRSNITSMNKMITSILEITDEDNDTNKKLEVQEERSMMTTSYLSTSRSIPSTAAVARGNTGNKQLGNKREHYIPAKILIKKKTLRKNHYRGIAKKKKKNKDGTNALIDSELERNYRKMFIPSNAPQFIAKIDGSIVTCNESLVKETGLSRNEILTLSLFSIVRGDRLSRLFRMLGKALRSRCNDDDNNNSVNDNSTTDKESTLKSSSSSDATSSESGNTIINKSSSKTTTTMMKPWMNYAVKNLPCISFQTTTTTNDDCLMNHRLSSLYMTVTLVTDSNPPKQYFHCILTDKPKKN